VEGARTEQRERQERVIRDSVFDSSQASSTFEDSRRRRSDK
jgi:hypothetical protein